MKNLISYNGNAVAEYQEAVRRKDKSSPDRANLEVVEADIVSAYNAYKSNFDLNTLHLLSDTNRFHGIKKELLSLYNYQNKIVCNIRENIANQQLETIRTTCQNCTIDSVGTMDHILPKTSYPEYAVNAYNLFPCCSKCNEYKNIIVGQTKFLNLFLDELPEIQYLFVDVYANGDTLNFKFYLENKNDLIDKSLFETISNHFKNLHLLQRMKECSIAYLSDFISSIRPHLLRNNKAYVIETTLESIKEERKGYGYNYWKSSLKLALIESSVFWDYTSK